MDDGIPGETKEKSSQANGDQNGLLRPTQEIQAWKWHPLFIHTDSIFEVLDRKIPCQLLLFTLFVAN